MTTCANALCGSLVTATRTKALRSPTPRLGISEPIEIEQERMNREAHAWLLDKPKQKKRKEGSVDEDAICKVAEDWEREFRLELQNRTLGKIWYSNAVGKKARSVFQENRELFADLDLHELTDGTIEYILGIKEFQVWKWRTGQCRIPPKHRKKLEKLIQSLRF